MPTQRSVEHKLREELAKFAPQHLAIENESSAHAGYYPGKESHFKIIIVSDVFSGLRRVARHQLIFRQLAQYLTRHGGGIHALSLHTLTTQEWQQHGKQVPDSPDCAGRRE